MAKIPTPGPPVGKCKYCTINLYHYENGIDKPAIFPCGIHRAKGEGDKDEIKKFPEGFICPWETLKDQEKLVKVEEHELIAGLLGTDHGTGLD